MCWNSKDRVRLSKMPLMEIVKEPTPQKGGFTSYEAGDVHPRVPEPGENQSRKLLSAMLMKNCEPPMREDKRTGTESFMKRIYFVTCWKLEMNYTIIYIQWQIIRLAMKAPPC